MRIAAGMLWGLLATTGTFAAEVPDVPTGNGPVPIRAVEAEGAEAPRPAPVKPPAGSPPPAIVDKPADSAADTESTAQDSDSPASEHVLQAIAHLKAAGLEQEARRLTQRLDLKRELERRSRELKQLTAEVQRLREIEMATREEPAVVFIRIKQIEIFEPDMPSSSGIIQQLGFRGPATPAVDGTAAPGRLADDSAELIRPLMLTQLETDSAEKLLDALQKLAPRTFHTLSTPTLAILDGSSGSMFTGQEVPVLIPDGDGKTEVQFRELGFRLEMSVHLRPDGQIELTAKFRDSILAQSGAKLAPEIGPFEGVRTSQSQFVTRLKPGHSAIAFMPRPKSGAGSLILMTPEVESGEQFGFPPAD